MTDKPLIHHDQDKKRDRGIYIVCARCGFAGGTLEKQGDVYVHADKEKCRILQLRRRK